MVDETARKLGLEVQYRKQLTLPEEKKKLAEQELEAAISKVQQLTSEVAAAEKERDALEGTAESYKSQFGEGEKITQRARDEVALATQKLEKLGASLELATLEAAAKRTVLKNHTWDPAVPEF